MKKKKSVKSMTAIRWGTGLFLFLFWLGSMLWITKDMACKYYDQLALECDSAAERLAIYGDMIGGNKWKISDVYSIGSTFRLVDNYEENYKYGMLSALKMAEQERITQYQNDDEKYDYPIQTAILFLDQDKQQIIKSGDYLYFHYIDEDDWEYYNKHISGITWDEFGYVDLSKYPLKEEVNDYHLGYMKLVGEIVENEVLPVRMEYMEYDESEWQIIYEDEEYSVNQQQINNNKDEYNKNQTQTNDENKSKEDNIVTIYAYAAETIQYEEGPSITYSGKKYENLLELLEWKKEHGLGNYSGDEYENEDNLWIYMNFESVHFYDMNDMEEQNGTAEKNEAGEQSDSDDEPGELKYTMLVAAMGSPIYYAFMRLYKLYLISLVVLLLGWRFFFNMMERQFVAPIAEINKGICNDFGHISNIDNDSAYWQEVQELRGNYRNTQDKFRMQKNEITRLQTALDFSQKAEQSRRQLTSNIAHELKTPLAIIHSYSEGLKEHIADEKKEEYYDVILSETERMDTMVMEMLDLSRLEAGKVKLARDEFDLTFMVQNIFDLLSNLAKGKNLNITFQMDEECIVHADEARIYQVVSNFASNAVRYTPVGGTIVVRVYRGRGTTNCSIENTSRHFTQEERSKVWDTFYRTDKSRNSKGTGLGLAIAKNIIDLHRGKCYVENTKIGVKFQFVLFD